MKIQHFAFIASLFLFAMITSVSANAPLNDMRANAIQVPGNGQQYTISNEFATAEPGDFPGRTVYRTLWWKWTAPADGLVKIETLNSAGASTHMVLACHLHNGGGSLGAEIQTFPLIGSATTLPKSSFPVAKGTNYIFGIGVWKSTESGIVNFSLSLDRTHSVATIPSSHTVTMANDAFAGRILLSGNEVRAIGYNKMATREAGEPTFPNKIHDTIYRSLWWTYRPSQNGVLHIEVNPGGSTARALSCAAFIGSNIQSLSLAERAVAGTSQVVSFNLPVTAGVDYHLGVGSYSEDDPGAVVLSLRLDTSSQVSSLNIAHPATMTNDHFSNRITLTGTNPSVIAYNHNATNEAGEVSGAPAANFWWTYRPAVSGELQISSNGGSFNPGVIVFMGSWPGLKVVGYNQIGGTTTLKFPVTSGVDYYICAGSVGTTQGSIVLSLSMNENADPYSFANYSGPASVSNDMFGNAIQLSGENVSAMAYNAQATNEPNETDYKRYGYRTMWWKWTASANGQVIFNPNGCKDVLGNTLPVNVNIVPELGASNVLGPINGVPSFMAQAGKTYYICIGSLENLSHSFGTLFFTLSAPPSPPVVTTPAASHLILAGSSFNLFVEANGGSLNFQWYRNGKAVSGATSRVYSVSAANLSHAGAYFCRVSNGVGSADSQVARVGVMEASLPAVTANSGGTLTLQVQLSVPSGGNAVVYRWRKNGSNLSDGGRVSGSGTARLVISGLDAGDAASYSCRITFDGKTLTTNGAVVTIRGLPVVNPVPAQIWSVSQTITLALTSQNGATRYTASGLPSGVTFDPITGQFGGKPNRVGNHTIRVYASNAAGKSLVVEIPVTVNTLDTANLGNFDGLVARNTTIGNYLGGWVSVSVSSSGGLSGSMRMADGAYRFKGRLDASVGEEPVARITVPRGKLAPFSLTLNFDTARKRASGPLSDGIYSANVRVDQRTWNARSNPASTWAGSYNIVMDLPEDLAGNEDYPQGSGFARMTLKPDGAVRLAGKTGDGMAFALGTYFWRERYVPVFALMHANKASLRGLIRVNAGGPAPDYPDNRVVVSNLDWFKNESFSTRDKLYREGFGFISLNVDGSKWVVPERGSNVLDVEDDGFNNAQIVFARGGQEEGNPSGSPLITGSGVRANLNQLFRMDGSSRCFFDRNQNSAAVALKVNSKTGLINGSYKVVDRVSDATSARRTVKFEGLMLQHRREGFGFFQAPPLQAPGILAGQVFLSP